MFIYSLASLIPLTVLLALIVVSGRAIWLAVMPPRRCVKEASCEKCKYPVAGLSTWTCPECGSHLLTVGIVTRSMEMRRRGSYVGAISGVLFLLFMAGVIALSVALATLGGAAGMLGTGTYVQTSPITETSGVLPPMTLSIEQDWSTGMPPRAILRPAGAADLDELRIEYLADGVVNEELLTQWMSDAGVKVTDPKAVTAIGELTRYLSGSNAQNGMWVTSSDLPSFTVGNVSTTTRPPAGQEDAYFWFRVFMWSIPGSGILLFAIFAFVIVRRRRKLLREADQPLSRPSVSV